ncbi:MAG: hypothetical protein QOJ31_931 [Gaiellales bacterium]|jgi:AcrR family transcriptional regulator|nr:hypothetical protein [Gaiellales bacterium]MDX6545175.1 hypothetical protein [Gaiellales bacterium]MDX6550247.1 hypothetical protein [Gaiellales bacterium]
MLEDGRPEVKMTSPKQPRTYQLKRRAERQAETRLRITEATMALHESVGPAHTTVSEVARLAGVQRATVYNHFPDDRSLFAACSAHWVGQHPRPDPAACAGIPDPAERTACALAGLYGWYEANRRMLTHVVRDAELLPPLRSVLAEGLDGYLAAYGALLMRDRRARGERQRRLAAGIDLAVQFTTWRRLSERGLSPVEASGLMAEMIEAAGAAGRARGRAAVRQRDHG